MCFFLDQNVMRNKNILFKKHKSVTQNKNILIICSNRAIIVISLQLKSGTCVWSLGPIITRVELRYSTGTIGDQCAI